MKILVTGAKGFVGRNLCENLKAVRDGKNRTRPALQIEDVFEYDLDTPPAELDHFCAQADFVFNLAGVNRPKNNDEFMQGNFGFASTLLDTLKSHANRCPVRSSSSPTGRRPARRCWSTASRICSASGAAPTTTAPWRPSAITPPTTCPSRSMTAPPSWSYCTLTTWWRKCSTRWRVSLTAAITPVFHDSGRYCAAPVTHKVTLGEIADLLERFKAQPATLVLPEIPAGSFAKKLYSTYLSYLPKEKVIFDLKKNEDARGSFTELLKTESCGQFSVNVSKPGITKGQHWHNTKWEFFIVVSGHGLIQERRVGSGEVLEFEVTGDKPQAIHMLPGYTHNIINLSETESLVTLMWANEQFDPAHPDTFFEKV